MTAAKQVNERQLNVLRWIADGCPNRSWPDDTHKHSARALQSRGLAHVARRRGVWVAEITEVGRYYIEHGDYPSEAGDVRARLGRRRRRTAVSSPLPEVPQSALMPPAISLGPAAPDDAQWLLMRLVAAGGRLEIETKTHRAAVDELQKAPYVPDGKVVKTRHRGWHHQLLYLADDPPAVVPERNVPVPTRLARAHLAAHRYREDSDHHEVSVSQLARATQIVHALATVFDELGYDLAEGYRTPDGQFVVRGGAGDVPIRISEKSAPGGAPVSPFNPSGGRRPRPAWQRRRQTTFISTGRLTIVVGGQYGGRGGRQCRFSDPKTRRLEDQLPGVVREVEMRFFEQSQDQAEADREDREQEALWRRVLAGAEHLAVEEFRADVLAQRAAAWREWQEQSSYVELLSGSMWKFSKDERAAVEKWLDWARRRLANTDPILAGHGMPTTPTPTKEFLAPHIRGWVGLHRGFDGQD